MCSGHENSNARNKSGHFVREHLQGWRMTWRVSGEGKLELRHDLKAPAKCRPGDSRSQTEWKSKCIDPRWKHAEHLQGMERAWGFTLEDKRERTQGAIGSDEQGPDLEDHGRVSGFEVLLENSCNTECDIIYTFKSSGCWGRIGFGSQRTK